MSLDDVREKLMSNARVVIDELIGKAQNIEEKSFKSSIPTPAMPPDSESMKVTLEDGTVANVKMTTPGGVQ